MKQLTLLVVTSLLFGCANTKFVIFGVEVNKQNASLTLAGALTSIGTHVGGHYIAAGIFDVGIEQDGSHEILTSDDQSDLRWTARGGFLLQSLVGTALVIVKPKSYFTKGFVSATFVELGTYSARNGDSGDFETIDLCGGDAQREFNIYVGLGLYNLIALE